MAKKLADNKDEFDFSDIIETSNKKEEFDFTDIVEPKKKLEFTPTFSTNVEDYTKPSQNGVEITAPSPLSSNLKSVAKPIPQVVDKDPVSKTNLYKGTIANIRKRNSDNLLLAEDYRLKGDEDGMRAVLAQIDQDQRKIAVLDKGIEAQRKAAEEMGYDTKGESSLRGLKNTLAMFLTAPEGIDKSLSALERSFIGLSGVDSQKMTKDILDWKNKIEAETGKPISVLDANLSDDLAVIGRKILDQSNKEKGIANLGSKYGGDIGALIKSGDYKEIISQGVNVFLENAPTSIAFLTVPTAIGVGGGMMNQEITEAEKEGREVGAQVVAAGAIKVALEVVTENMLGGGKVVKELVTSLGKEAAEKVVKETVEKAIKEGFLKKYGKAISEEVLGEVTNQIGSNAVDIYMNGKKDVKLSDGIDDAAFAAIFSSGIQTTPTLLAQKYVDKKAVAASQEKKAQAAKLLEEAVMQPTQTAQDAVEEKAHKLEAEANKEIEKHVEVAKKATEEDLVKIDELDNSIDEITASIGETSDTEVAGILEEKKQELESEREKTIKAIEKRPKADKNQETIIETPKETTPTPTPSSSNGSTIPTPNNVKEEPNVSIEPTQVENVSKKDEKIDTKIEAAPKEGEGVNEGVIIGKEFKDEFNRTFEVISENTGIVTIEDTETGKILKRKKAEVLSYLEKQPSEAVSPSAVEKGLADFSEYKKVIDKSTKNESLSKPELLIRTELIDKKPHEHSKEVFDKLYTVSIKSVGNDKGITLKNKVSGENIWIHASDISFFGNMLGKESLMPTKVFNEIFVDKNKKTALDIAYKNKQQEAEYNEFEKKRKTNLTEKAPIGETTEKPTAKETLPSKSPVFDDKNMTNPLLSPFIEVINNSKDLEEAYSKIKSIKDVPQEAADEFSRIYNPNNNKSQKQAFTDFYGEVKSGSQKNAVQETGTEKKTEQAKKITKALNIAEVEAVAKALAKEQTKPFEKGYSTERNNARNEKAKKELAGTANAETILAITKNIDAIREKLLASENIKAIDCGWFKK